MRLAVVSLLFGVIAACGGGGDRSEGSEGSLREAATTYFNAVMDGEPSRAYSFFHESYREKCPSDDFAGLLILGLSFYPELKDAELRINSVTVDGDRGSVDGDYFLDDRPLGFNQEDDETDNYWLFDDGKWWVATDDPAPCDL